MQRVIFASAEERDEILGHIAASAEKRDDILGHIAASWKPLRSRPAERRQHEAEPDGHAPSAQDAPRACLMEMPAVIIGGVFEHLIDFGVGFEHLMLIDFRRGEELSSLLALDQTCRAFHNLLGDDGMWKKIFPKYAKGELGYRPVTCREAVFHSRALRNIRLWQAGPKQTEDIVSKYLGGLRGVRDFARPFLRHALSTTPKRVPVESFSLRVDAIAYLTEIVQGHMIEKLRKVNLMVNEYHNCQNSYPKVMPKDLRLLDTLAYDRGFFEGRHHTRVFHHNAGYMFGLPPLHHNEVWWFNRDHCESAMKADDLAREEVLGADKRFKMARTLAYRAGIVKMSGEAFSLLALETLHRMATLVHDACVVAHCVACSYEPASGQGESRPDELPWDFIPDELPSLQRSGDGSSFRYVITPSHIKDAALRNGMKPLVGFDELAVERAPGDDDAAEDEAGEADSGYHLGEDTSESEDESYTSDSNASMSIEDIEVGGM